MVYKKAIVKFNNGNGALLCNSCSVILCEGYGFVDKLHYCDKCIKSGNWVDSFFPEEKDNLSHTDSDDENQSLLP